MGNIQRKSDFASTYYYGDDAACAAQSLAGPNAVCRVDRIGGGRIDYRYDAVGNLLAGESGTQHVYDAYNLTTLSRGGGETRTFGYGADGQRYFQNVAGGERPRRLLYLDKAVEVEIDGAGWQVRQYLGGYGILTQRQDSAGAVVGHTLSFAHKDRLGSVVTLTNENAQVLERRGFDPFGKPRTGSWRDMADPEVPSEITPRGFTEHEHMNAAGLIHMNGRIYDYNLGRFYSVDPYIVDPKSSQSINPYSYIYNNPLAGTDPTGYITVTHKRKVVTGSRIPKDFTTVTLDNGKSATYRGTATQEEVDAHFAGANGAQSLPVQRAGPADVGSIGESSQKRMNPVTQALLGVAGPPFTDAVIELTINGDPQAARQSFHEELTVMGAGAAGGAVVGAVVGGVGAAPGAGLGAAGAQKVNRARKLWRAIKSSIFGQRRADVPDRPFAMGIDDHLDDFARRNNATTWKQFDDVENWQPQVLDKLNDPNQKVLFNLDGVDVWGGVSRSSTGRGTATDWELLQIRQNPQTWETLDFIKDGVKVGNPFE